MYITHSAIRHTKRDHHTGNHELSTRMYMIMTEVLSSQDLHNYDTMPIIIIMIIRNCDFNSHA